MLERLSASLTYKAARAFGRRTLPLRLERPVVSLTFDDFPVSAWEVGGAILARHGVRGTFYVAGGLCGTEFDGNRIIDASDLAAVAEAGHEIGCHTAHHRTLRGLAKPDILAELEANAAFLREHVPQERMTTFAYPYGELSLGTKQVVSRRFAACRGVWADVNAGTVDLGLLGCVCLEPHILAQRSIKDWIAEAVRLNGWLIFLTHDVSETPGPFGTTPDILEEVVTTALNAGCDVLPVKNALGLAAYGRTVTHNLLA